MDAIEAANAELRARGYTERDLAVHSAPRGRALLKGNKLLSPLSDDPDVVLRVVRELVPPHDELGSAVLRPSELRANL
jgi:hypothetical protein